MCASIKKNYLHFQQGSPELLEVKMGAEGFSEGSEDNNRDIDNDQDDSIEVSWLGNYYV